MARAADAVHWMGGLPPRHQIIRMGRKASRDGSATRPYLHLDTLYTSLASQEYLSIDHVSNPGQSTPHRGWVAPQSTSTRHGGERKASYGKLIDTRAHTRCAAPMQTLVVTPALQENLTYLSLRSGGAVERCT